MYEPYNSERLNVIKQIYKKIAYLNPALRRVAEYILENPAQCKTMVIKELAEACCVAESTVTRFVKEIGINNYQMLKIGITETLTLSNDLINAPKEKYIYENVTKNDSIENIFDKVVYRNVQTLLDTKQRLNLEAVKKAVEIIEQANVLIFCCMGSSCVAAEEAVVRFIRAGKKCLLFRDGSIQTMTAAIVNPTDALIGISNSGKTIQVVNSLKLGQSNGAKTIGITAFEDAPLVKYSDITLFTPTKIPSFESGLCWEVTTSKIAQILVIDILYACFTVKTFDQAIKYLEDTYLAARDTRK